MKKKLTIICSLLYLFNSFLHLLLLLGAPLGEYVLGGKYVIIPLPLRIINLLFFILWLLASYIYLSYSDIIKSRIKHIYLKRFITYATIFTTIAIFSNLFITSSNKERALMLPLTIIVSICSIALLKIDKQ